MGSFRTGFKILSDLTKKQGITFRQLRSYSEDRCYSSLKFDELNPIAEGKCSGKQIKPAKSWFSFLNKTDVSLPPYTSGRCPSGFTSRLPYDEFRKVSHCMSSTGIKRRCDDGLPPNVCPAKVMKMNKGLSVKLKSKEPVEPLVERMTKLVEKPGLKLPADQSEGHKSSVPKFDQITGKVEQSLEPKQANNLPHWLLRPGCQTAILKEKPEVKPLKQKSCEDVDGFRFKPEEKNQEPTVANYPPKNNQDECSCKVEPIQPPKTPPERCILMPDKFQIHKSRVAAAKSDKKMSLTDFIEMQKKRLTGCFCGMKRKEMILFDAYRYTNSSLVPGTSAQCSRQFSTMLSAHDAAQKSNGPGLITDMLRNASNSCKDECNKCEQPEEVCKKPPKRQLPKQQPCGGKPPKKCCGVMSLPCCKPGRCPPDCGQERPRPACRKVLAPKPSYSECMKDPLCPQHPSECTCWDKFDPPEPSKTCGSQSKCGNGNGNGNRKFSMWSANMSPQDKNDVLFRKLSNLSSIKRTPPAPSYSEVLKLALEEGQPWLLRTYSCKPKKGAEKKGGCKKKDECCNPQLDKGPIKTWEDCPEPIDDTCPPPCEIIDPVELPGCQDLCKETKCGKKDPCKKDPPCPPKDPCKKDPPCPPPPACPPKDPCKKEPTCPPPPACPPPPPPPCPPPCPPKDPCKKQPVCCPPKEPPCPPPPKKEPSGCPPKKECGGCKSKGVGDAISSSKCKVDKDKEGPCEDVEPPCPQQMKAKKERKNCPQECPKKEKKREDPCKKDECDHLKIKQKPCEPSPCASLIPKRFLSSSRGGKKSEETEESPIALSLCTAAYKPVSMPELPCPGPQPDKDHKPEYLQAPTCISVVKRKPCPVKKCDSCPKVKHVCLPDRCGKKGCRPKPEANHGLWTCFKNWLNGNDSVKPRRSKSLSTSRAAAFSAGEVGVSVTCPVEDYQETLRNHGPVKFSKVYRFDEDYEDEISDRFDEKKKSRKNKEAGSSWSNQVEYGNENSSEMKSGGHVFNISECYQGKECYKCFEPSVVEYMKGRELERKDDSKSIKYNKLKRKRGKNDTSFKFPKTKKLLSKSKDSPQIQSSASYSSYVQPDGNFLKSEEMICPKSTAEDDTFLRLNFKPNSITLEQFSISDIKEVVSQEIEQNLFDYPDKVDIEDSFLKAKDEN